MSKITNEEKKKIIESTDQSMDEMGTVQIHGFGMGERSERMTRREAMLKGYDKDTGPTVAWVSDKSVEEKRIKEEENRRKEDEEKSKREEEIRTNTDPSMDEMVTIELNGHTKTDFGVADHYKINVSKREKMLIDEGILDAYKIYQEQSKEEQIRKSKEYKEKLAKEIGEIMLSKDKQIDEEVKFGVYSKENPGRPGNRNKIFVSGTRREMLLWEKGVLPERTIKSLIDEKKVIETKKENEEKNSSLEIANHNSKNITFSKIKQVVAKLRGKDKEKEKEKEKDIDR